MNPRPADPKRRRVTRSKARKSPLVLTIGHSNRTLQDFVEMLQAHAVKKLADVRTVPRSRYNPQFNRDTLPNALREARIGYVHMPGLGGLRHPRADSPNSGWRNASFRGFADYMQTPEFEAVLHALIDLAREEQIAIMCAEAVPWRCHRSLIADALTVHGVSVEHILSTTHRQAHSLTPWARVKGGRLTYPDQSGRGDRRLEKAKPPSSRECLRGRDPDTPDRPRSFSASDENTAGGLLAGCSVRLRWELGVGG